MYATGLLICFGVKVLSGADFQSPPPPLCKEQLALVAQAVGGQSDVSIKPTGSQWTISGRGVEGSIASDGRGVLWVRVNQKQATIVKEGSGYRISFPHATRHRTSLHNIVKEGSGYRISFLP